MTAVKNPKLREDLFIMEKDDRVLFLNAEVPDWITINKRFKPIFEFFDGTHNLAEITSFVTSRYPSEEELKHQVLELLSTSSLFDDNAPAQHPVRDSHLKQVYLTLTGQCNLSCAYCYATVREPRAEGSLSQWILYVDKLLGIRSPLTFVFTGGEPLLVPFVIELAKYTKGKGCSNVLLTNGTLIRTKKCALAIASYFDLVRLSLDSVEPRINDSLRGNGVAEKVKAAVELLKKVDANYQVLCTVTKKNLGEVESISSNFDNQVSFQPLYVLGRAEQKQDLCITGSEYYDSLTRSGIFKYLPSYRNNIHTYRRNPFKRCSVGVEELSIDTEGNVYPCHMLHYDNMHVCNIDSEDVLERYQRSGVLERIRSMNVDTIVKCRSCIVRNFCGGSCRARPDYEANADPGTKPFCEFEYKVILDALLYSYG